MSVSDRGSRSYRRGAVAQRALDLAGASIALALLWPVLVLAALAVRWRLGTPVLFRQVRAGRDGAPFELLKFRSMRDLVGPDGTALPDEARLTRFGAWLRSTSIDELPSLWNVLRGQMSLVGPRPLYTDYLPLYDAHQARRHEVRPGVTGWSQVNGRNALSWDDKFALDVWYVDHRSIALDAKILAMTVLKVLRREGISAEGHATNVRFRGSAGARGAREAPR